MRGVNHNLSKLRIKSRKARVVAGAAPATNYVKREGRAAMRTVRPGDAAKVASDLRPCDLLDITAASRSPPLAAIEESVRTSEAAYTWEFDDQVVAIGGVTAPAAGSMAMIWLIGTNRFEKALRSGSWRVFESWMHHTAGRHPVVFNHVPEGNIQTIRWLSLMGFKQVRRIENFRGLGHVCILMVLDRRLRSSREQSVTGPAKDPAFAFSDPRDFGAMLDLERYVDRSDAFDQMIAASEEHFWDPLDKRYIDLETAFDLRTKALVGEDRFKTLRCPTVAAKLSSAEDRVRFINKVVWLRFSTLLHGEQGALNLAASLCGVLKDQRAQEFISNQVREEARHVTAFSTYIKARWGRPAPCLPALRAFLGEIIQSPDVAKKIIGMQVMVEGLAMGTLASLYRDLQDPAGKRLVQLVMTDEAFHHRFGRLWSDRTMPKLSARERRRLEEWTSHCIQNFILKMDPPVELMTLQSDFGLNSQQIADELQQVLAASGEAYNGMGSREIFRVLTKVLNDAGLISERTRGVYQAFVDMDGLDEIDLEHSGILDDGMGFLRDVNAGRARPLSL